MCLIKLRVMIAMVVIASCVLINSIANHAALTSNGVDSFLNQEPQKEEPGKGFVGFRLGDGPEPRTIAVVGVGKGGPAEKAGIRAGDILIKVDDFEVKTGPDTTLFIINHKPGDQVIMLIRRDGKEMRIPVTVGTRPASATRAPGPATPPESYDPLVKIQTEDYARARLQFKTKLLRQGPAPQPWKPVKPPAGVTEVEYTSGALKLKAWVSHAADEKRKSPAVLFLHGGFAFDYPDDWNISQPYRDAGYVVLTPMLRAENGQPGDFSFLYNEVDDVLAAAAYLSKLPYVDAKRLYLAGPSAGGTLALLTAMTTSRFRAVASFSASPDQVLLCARAKYAARDVPVDINDLRELEMRSPLAYAASLKCPARIYVGTQEPQFQTTNQLTAKLAKEHGVDAEAILVAGDHDSSVPPGIKQSIAFFQKR
jgi:dipeptidyl aminopeptidase/acylaminoacyl peptidase